MFHDSCKYYLIHLRFLYQDIIFVSYISYKNYLSNLTYIFLLFYISVAVFEYFCEYVNYLWIYRNRLIKIEPSSRPSRVEFSKKGESQWRQSETVVSTGMHNVHPARIEKSSQLCLLSWMVQPYTGMVFRMESLVSSRAFFKQFLLWHLHNI